MEIKALYEISTLTPIILLTIKEIFPGLKHSYFYWGYGLSYGHPLSLPPPPSPSHSTNSQLVRLQVRKKTWSLKKTENVASDSLTLASTMWKTPTNKSISVFLKFKSLDQNTNKWNNIKSNFFLLFLFIYVTQRYCTCAGEGINATVRDVNVSFFCDRTFRFFPLSKKNFVLFRFRFWIQR